MKKMNRIVKRLVLSMVMAMTGVVTHATTGILARADKTEMNRWVDSVMSTMNEREKVAQLMVVIRPNCISASTTWWASVI